jgi:uncharacterized membrane protein YeiH
VPSPSHVRVVRITWLRGGEFRNYLLSHYNAMLIGYPRYQLINYASLQVLARFAHREALHFDTETT